MEPEVTIKIINKLRGIAAARVDFTLHEIRQSIYKTDIFEYKAIIGTKETIVFHKYFQHPELTFPINRDLIIEIQEKGFGRFYNGLLFLIPTALILANTIFIINRFIQIASRCD